MSTLGELNIGRWVKLEKGWKIIKYNIRNKLNVGWREVVDDDVERAELN